MPRRPLAPLSFALVALLAGACAPKPPPQAPPAPAGAASVAHWDPVTGRFVEPPADVARTLATQRRAAAAAMPAAREEASPRGGMMVRLGTRFQHNMSAEVTADGVATSGCEMQ